jgi:hypothetical protein
MRATILFTLSMVGCDGAQESAVDAELPPPPAPLVVPACAPGSAFELNGVAYADLQLAFDDAVGGDTVVICAGTHSIGGTRVHVDGVTIAGETGDPADVKLTDGSISIQPFTTPAPVGTINTASGFTLVNADLIGGGTVDLRLADLRIEGPGASVYAESRSVYVYRSTFIDGVGGRMLEVGVYDAEVHVALDEVRFENNITDDSVVWVHNLDLTPAPGRVRMRNVDWVGNVSTAVFSPLALFTDDIQLEVIGGSVVGNTNPNAAIFEVFGVRGPSRIQGWTVTDNVVGFPAVNLMGEVEPLVIRDSVFLRNDWPTAPFVVGSALLVEGPTARLFNVDFGVGADTNLPADIATCGLDYGLVNKAKIRYPSRCPR